MRGHPVLYSSAERAWVKAHATMKRADMHTAFCVKFDRVDVSFDALKQLCQREGWLTGRSGSFVKGNAPANKGRKMPFNANSAATRFKKGERHGATRFKKGERHGRANEIYKPIGSERLSKEGYVERKINDDMPLQARWRAVHLIRWEEIYGPIGESNVLKSLDGDKQNTDPSNWTLVHRAVLARLNGGPQKSFVPYDSAPEELKPTILAVAKLQHRARQARKTAADPAGAA